MSYTVITEWILGTSGTSVSQNKDTLYNTLTLKTIRCHVKWFLMDCTDLNKNVNICKYKNNLIILHLLFPKTGE